MPHVRLGNSFEALQEEEGLLQDQRTINVEDVVVCTPDAKLNSAKVSRENVMRSPSPPGKSGSVRLRAAKEWLRNGKYQESSPINSETRKLQETRQVRMGVDGQVQIKFVLSKRLVKDNFDKGCKFSQ